MTGTYTLGSIRELMKSYGQIFDVVRLVEPDQTTAHALSERGDAFETPYVCYKLLNRQERCSNCISRQTVRERRTLSKYEVVGGTRLYVVSQYVEVEGRPYSLELIRRVEGEMQEPER